MKVCAASTVTVAMIVLIGLYDCRSERASTPTKTDDARPKHALNDWYAVGLHCEDGEKVRPEVALAAMKVVYGKLRFGIANPERGPQNVSAQAPVWMFGQWRERVARGQWEFVRSTSEVKYGAWQTVGAWDGVEPQIGAYSGTLTCDDHAWILQSHSYMQRTL
jgi:hypothetical protein